MRSYFNMLDSIQGLLFGQVVGDAFGAKYKFLNKSEIDILLESNKEKEVSIQGGGPFNITPGQITNNSEMALTLVESILKNKGYCKENVFQRYKEWLESKPIYVGLCVLKCLGNSHSYAECIEYSKKINSQNNGCLMRISPLAAIGYKMTKHKLCQLVEEDCRMTHSHPNIIDAAKVYILSIQDALQKKSKRQILRNALYNSNTDTVKDIIQNSKKTPFPSINNVEILNDNPEHIDYFGIAIQNMFYEFIHSDDLYKSIVNIVNRGGDTNTNACISGAFLGAFYGIHKIPDIWKKSVSNLKKNIRHNEYSLSNTNQLYQLSYYLYTLNTTH